MKTFVRCIVATFFFVGIAGQAMAQSNTSEKDKNFKHLSQEQIDQLTQEQINYLKENDIEVIVQDATSKDGSKTYTANELESRAQKRGNISDSNDQPIDPEGDGDYLTAGQDDDIQRIQVSERRLNQMSADEKEKILSNPEKYAVVKTKAPMNTTIEK